MSFHILCKTSFVNVTKLDFHIYKFVNTLLKCMQEIYRWPTACDAGAAAYYTNVGRFQSWQLAPSGSQH